MNNIKGNIGRVILAILLFSCNSSAQKSNVSVQEFEKAIGQKEFQALAAAD